MKKIILFDSNKFSKNFLRKTKLFLRLIVIAKFFFRDPAKKKIVIYDCEGAWALKVLLADYNFSVISTRAHKIKEIYISKRIIFYILNNLFKRSLKQNYLVSLIKAIDPKLVITQIDNSLDFYITAKTLKKDIKFIAFQGGHRTSPLHEREKIFIPEFLCFSEFDKKNFQANKANVEKFEIVGSLRASLSYEYCKIKNIKINPKKYDICLISESRAINNEQDKIVTDNTAMLAEYTHTLCKKNNLKLIFTGESDINLQAGKYEINFYKKYLKKGSFKISQAPRSEYPSYINIMQSRLTIALKSTLLREAIGLNEMALACYWSGYPDDSFPIDDICQLTDDSYESFEKRVLKILSMDKSEYFKILGKKKDFIMSPCENTKSFLKSKIDKLLINNSRL